MITTAQLIKRLDNIDEAAAHHTNLAAQGVTPVTNASYALAYAAKAELLRSLIALSRRSDKEADQ